MKKITKIGLVLILIGVLSSIVLVTIFRVDMSNVLKISNNSPFINFGTENNDQTIYEEYEGFTNLNIDIDLGEVVIEQGSKFSVKIDYCSKCKYNFSASNENNTLTVTGRKKGNFFFNANSSSPVVKITVPSGTNLNEVDIDSDLGVVKVIGQNIRKLEIEASMGDVVVNDNIINEASIDAKMGSVKVSSDIVSLELEVSMGEVVFKGATNKLEVNNSMGATNVEIKGNVDDYRIKAKSSMGSLSVDGQKEDGMNNSLELNQDKNLENYIEVKNSMGAVDIRFIK